ncbi:MAG TPA: Rpn family recombination-promoting nuclease/putative transposase [Pirellulales bacterium]|nr:Rpn family recombination-promoting nuclease/putative transposase [Pirellulales bacterium]
MKPQSDPKVDYAFKHVFGREQGRAALMSLLDAVLQPAAGREIAGLELLNPFNDKETLDDKLSILDIKARDQSGRQFNVEMQMLAYGAFPQRALYYWSRLHQSQLQEGMNYHVLRPTIAICFVDTSLFPDVPDHHLVFELRERRHQTLFTDQLAVHILELPKFDKTVDDLATPLDRWLFFLRHAQDLDEEALPEPLDVAEVRWALGDLIMITQSDEDRERYESRLKMQRDVYTALFEAREEGRAEGQIARIQSFQRLLREEVTALEQLRALSPVELESLAARLESELNAKLTNGS